MPDRDLRTLSPHTTEDFLDLQLWKYIFAAAAALFVWDWAITLEDEVYHLWKAKRSLFSFLWINLRYGPMVMYGATAYTVFQETWDPRICGYIAILPTIFVLIFMTMVHVVFILRTYALYAQDIRIIWGLGTIVLVEIGLIIWTCITAPHTHVPKGFGCIPASPGRLQGIMAWGIVFTFDTAVLCLTLNRTIGYVRRQSRLPIVQIMIRDGIGYFVLMLLVYVTNILLFVFAPAGLQDVNAALAATITVICTQRLIFNLRDVPSSDGMVPDHSTTHSQNGPYYLSQPVYLVQTWLTEVGHVLDRRHGLEPSVHEHEHDLGYMLNDLSHDAGDDDRRRTGLV